jgi:hypothetical protein
MKIFLKKNIWIAAVLAGMLLGMPQRIVQAEVRRPYSEVRVRHDDHRVRPHYRERHREYRRHVVERRHYRHYPVHHRDRYRRY